MSVYIKGFPLPNNCGACPLRLAWCRERIYMVTRPERCPLVPVPPHGDLIDRDEIPYKKIMLDDDGEFYYGVTQPYIDRMPAVIEAEEVTDG